MAEILLTRVGEGDGWRQVQVTGPTTIFHVDFPFFGLDDIFVFHDPPAGDPVKLHRGFDYDVAGTADSSGIYATADVVTRQPVTDGTITLARHTAVQNDASFPLTGYFDRKALNAEFDRITCILQDLRREIEGSLRVAEPDQWNNPELVLPPLAQSPGLALMFDSLGHPFYGKLGLPGTLVYSPFGQQLLMCGGAGDVMDLLGFSAFFQSLVGAEDPLELRLLINAGLPTPDPIDSVPCGMIFPWPSVTLPNNTMACGGQSLLISDFSTLHDIIGTTYGTPPDGAHFLLPDLRGRLIAGRDDMGGVPAARITSAVGGINGTLVGAFGGVQAKQLTAAEMPTHTHAVPSSMRPGGALSGGGSNYVDYNFDNNGTSGAAGTGNGWPMLPPLMIQNYVIKVK